MDNVPVHANQHVVHHSKKQKKLSLKSIIITLFGLVVVAAIVFFGLFFLRANGALGIDSSKYQAVFLTSGQVYFGKLENFGSSYPKLTDVFYIQANSSDESQNLQETDASVTDLQLIKLGSEVHGPEDEMLIGHDQILFVENLKADGKVSASIKKYYDQLND